MLCFRSATETDPSVAKGVVKAGKIPDKSMTNLLRRARRKRQPGLFADPAARPPQCPAREGHECPALRRWPQPAWGYRVYCSESPRAESTSRRKKIHGPAVR